MEKCRNSEGMTEEKRESVMGQEQRKGAREREKIECNEALSQR